MCVVSLGPEGSLLRKQMYVGGRGTGQFLHPSVSDSDQSGFEKAFWSLESWRGPAVSDRNAGGSVRQWGLGRAGPRKGGQEVEWHSGQEHLRTGPWKAGVGLLGWHPECSGRALVQTSGHSLFLLTRPPADAIDQFYQTEK